MNAPLVAAFAELLRGIVDGATRALARLGEPLDQADPAPSSRDAMLRRKADALVRGPMFDRVVEALAAGRGSSR